MQKWPLNWIKIIDVYFFKCGQFATLLFGIIISEFGVGIYTAMNKQEIEHQISSNVMNNIQTKYKKYEVDIDRLQNAVTLSPFYEWFFEKNLIDYFSFV